MYRILTIVTLLGLGAWATWYAAEVWFSLDNVQLSFHGNLAMILGVVLTLIVGCGLMILMFYSSRRGHDDGVYHLVENSKEDDEA